MNSDIKRYNPDMSYRRFGKTEKKLSVITLGGMRYLHGWDSPRDQIPADTLANTVDSIQRAFDAGINHIETAFGYMKSEAAYGIALNDELRVPRDSYYLMTKGNPASASETRTLVEKQLKLLKTDYLDFYGWHGINNREVLETACAAGGPVEELLKLKDEGVIGHVGFSTHGPRDTLLEAVNTDLFDFINLHYYYFFQRHNPVIDLAAEKDMGVFIISPNDKGGQLFSPSPKLRELCLPRTPLAWNSRFCLSHPQIHTLSFGMHDPLHFKQMEDIFPLGWDDEDRRILEDMDRQWEKDFPSTLDYYGMENDSSGMNIPEYMRLRGMWRCFDMLNFGKYRYNMFSADDHWVHGAPVSREALDKMDRTAIPEGVDLEAALLEAHKAFTES